MKWNSFWTDKYNPLPRPIYKKKVSKWEYKWYTIDISDIAKYIWDYETEYKYIIKDPSWFYNIHIIMPMMCKTYSRKSNIFDDRMQHEYKDFVWAVETYLQNIKFLNSKRYNGKAD